MALARPPRFSSVRRASEGYTPTPLPRCVVCSALYVRSPRFQVAMLGLVCFMCPGLLIRLGNHSSVDLFSGLFNALSGIGGGGQIDESTGTQDSSPSVLVAFLIWFPTRCKRQCCPLFHLLRMLVKLPMAPNAHPHMQVCAFFAGCVFIKAAFHPR